MSRSRYEDFDSAALTEAIQASEYEFAFETQLREVIALSDFELAFQLQIDEAIIASNPLCNTAIADAGTSVTMPLTERAMTVTVSTRQHQPSTSRAVFVEECQSSSHRDGKELMTIERDEENLEKYVLKFSQAVTHEVLKYSPCMICLEIMTEAQLFNGLGCSHTLCIPCLVKYVQVTILEAKLTTLPCAEPSCHEYVSMQACEQFLPSAMIDAWKNVIVEQDFAPESQRVYCPYKDCVALLVRDPSSDTDTMKSAECPFCHRLFCMDCMVPWHANRSCIEYKRCPRDEKANEDFLLKDLVEQKKWQRCTNCKFYIELAQGCNHMTCRCGHQFCYVCGGHWSSNRHTCDNSMT